MLNNFPFFLPVAPFAPMPDIILIRVWHLSEPESTWSCSVLTVPVEIWEESSSSKLLFSLFSNLGFRNGFGWQTPGVK